MIYTDLTKKALKLCFEAHKEQTDKNGMPYVFHPFHLAEQMDDEYTTCIALLHDVVEDTDTTLEQLSLLFPKEIINAVALLTHDDAVPYLDYVKAIKKDPLALKVKLADLKHNSDITRLDTIDEKALNRLEKYKKALMILQEDQPSL
ncbi:MAG: GTP pyrophosphokinase [Clostridia bacterium]|nr:GTP pyrophosphokinase [Clostridia bacterium]